MSTSAACTPEPLASLSSDLSSFPARSHPHVLGVHSDLPAAGSLYVEVPLPAVPFPPGALGKLGQALFQQPPLLGSLRRHLFLKPPVPDATVTPSPSHPGGSDSHQYTWGRFLNVEGGGFRQFLRHPCLPLPLPRPFTRWFLP